MHFRNAVFMYSQAIIDYYYNSCFGTENIVLFYTFFIWSLIYGEQENPFIILVIILNNTIDNKNFGFFSNYTISNSGVARPLLQGGVLTCILHILPTNNILLVNLPFLMNVPTKRVLSIIFFFFTLVLPTNLPKLGVSHTPYHTLHPLATPLITNIDFEGVMTLIDS